MLSGATCLESLQNPRLPKQLEESVYSVRSNRGMLSETSEAPWNHAAPGRVRESFHLRVLGAWHTPAGSFTARIFTEWMNEWAGCKIQLHEKWEMETQRRTRRKPKQGRQSLIANPPSSGSVNSPTLASVTQESREGNPHLLEIWFFKIIYKAWDEIFLILFLPLHPFFFLNVTPRVNSFPKCIALHQQPLATFIWWKQ